MHMDFQIRMSIQGGCAGPAMFACQQTRCAQHQRRLSRGLTRLRSSNQASQSFQHVRPHAHMSMLAAFRGDP